MKWTLRILTGLVSVVGLIVIANLSIWAAAPLDAERKLISHRGVHQTYHREGLTSQTCTAERIDAPTHAFLENTIASAQAAFDYGADIVEIDIHLTTDQQFAVWHDWTLDCRTNAQGVTRSYSMDDLKIVDIGYGYTADGGTTYPFRGKGLGMMPELAELFKETSNGQFLINFKSDDVQEAELLSQRLQQNPTWRDRIWSAYGGDQPSIRASELIPKLNGFGRKAVRSCLITYIGLGWTGHVPETCQNTKIMVPINFAPLLWGWPNRFLERMRDANSEVIIIGPVSITETGTTGIDTIEQFQAIPAQFDGYVWTNKIEIIGPHAAQLTQ